MEFVPLSDMVLSHLVLDDPVLKRVFHEMHPSDVLPSRLTQTTRVAYIVNRDPQGEPRISRNAHYVIVFKHEPTSTDELLVQESQGTDRI